jgi:CRP/FNR family transcriptional regulator, cyclic AMP receptor protein
MDAMRALKAVVIFKDVAEPLLQIVARATEEISVPAGETIVSTAHAQDALYFIRNGTVRAIPDVEGAPPVLFGAGETIGEAQFIDGEPMKGTVTALERVDLLVIRSAKLADVLAGHPEVGYALYRAIARSLAGRLRRAIALVSSARRREERA